MRIRFRLVLVGLIAGAGIFAVHGPAQADGFEPGVGAIWTTVDIVSPFAADYGRPSIVCKVEGVTSVMVARIDGDMYWYASSVTRPRETWGHCADRTCVAVVTSVFMGGPRSRAVNWGGNSVRVNSRLYRDDIQAAGYHFAWSDGFSSGWFTS